MDNEFERRFVIPVTLIDLPKTGTPRIISQTYINDSIRMRKVINTDTGVERAYIQEKKRINDICSEEGSVSVIPINVFNVIVTKIGLPCLIKYRTHYSMQHDDITLVVTYDQILFPTEVLTIGVLSIEFPTEEMARDFQPPSDWKEKETTLSSYEYFHALQEHNKEKGR